MHQKGYDCEKKYHTVQVKLKITNRIKIKINSILNPRI